MVGGRDEIQPRKKDGDAMGEEADASYTQGDSRRIVASDGLTIGRKKGARVGSVRVVWEKRPDRQRGRRQGQRQSLRTKNWGLVFGLGNLELGRSLSGSWARCASALLVAVAACQTKVGQRAECFSELEERATGVWAGAPGSRVADWTSSRAWVLLVKHVPRRQKMSASCWFLACC